MNRASSWTGLLAMVRFGITLELLVRDTAVNWFLFLLFLLFRFVLRRDAGAIGVAEHPPARAH